MQTTQTPYPLHNEASFIKKNPLHSKYYMQGISAKYWKKNYVPVFDELKFTRDDNKEIIVSSLKTQNYIWERILDIFLNAEEPLLVGFFSQAEDNAAKIATQLAKALLAVKKPVIGIPLYRIHEWLESNQTADTILLLGLHDNTSKLRIDDFRNLCRSGSHVIFTYGGNISDYVKQIKLEANYYFNIDSTNYVK